MESILSQMGYTCELRAQGVWALDWAADDVA